MSKPVTTSKTTKNTGKYPPCEHFGWCPQCGRQDGSLNIGRAHYFVCHAHRTRWPVGSNLFSSWREEDETIWKRNHELLLTYREVHSNLLTPDMLEHLAETGFRGDSGDELQHLVRTGFFGVSDEPFRRITVHTARTLDARQQSR